MLAHDYLALKLVRLNSADGWSFKGDGLCVILAKAGGGKFAAGSIIQPIAPGDVLLLNGPAPVQLQAVAELIFSCFSMRLEHLYPLFTGAEISQLESVADSLRHPRHFPAALPLAKSCHRLVEEVSPQSSLGHRSQLLQVVSIILTEEFKAGHARRAGSLGVEEHLIQIFERLSADELLTISVGDLAAKFSCSRRHLNRLFHQYFGFSVASLRMEMRLLKSISLLRDGNAKIINVAEQCGFNHLGLFNTCFKRRFGVSPGQWRKQAVQAEIPPLVVPHGQGDCPLRSKGLCPLTGAYNSLLNGRAVASLSPSATYPRPPLAASVNPMIAAKTMNPFSHNGGAKVSP